VAIPNFFIFGAFFFLAFGIRAVAYVAVRAAADLVNHQVRVLIPVAVNGCQLAGIGRNAHIGGVELDQRIDGQHTGSR
jgi:hypothetical protein